MRSNKGFTLIELLIVLALLGILIVGLLAAIDPLEQIKKGNDTRMKNTAAEFFNAQLRYYGTANNLTWGTSTFNPVTMLGAASVTNAIATLIAAGELKDRFYENAIVAMSSLVLSSPTAGQVRLCFVPSSKNGRVDPNTVYNVSGSATSGCLAQTAGGATNCYWCLQ